MRPIILFCSILLATFPLVGQSPDSLLSQSSPADSSAAMPAGAPIVLDGDTLFIVRAPLGPFRPEDRARRSTENIALAVSEPGFSFDSIHVVDRASAVDVMFRDIVLFTITDDDLLYEGAERRSMAVSRLSRMRTILPRAEDSAPDVALDIDLLLSVGISLASLLALIAVFWLLRKIFPKIYSRLETWEGTLIRGIRIRSVDLVTSESMGDLFQILVRGVRLAISLIAIYVSLQIVLNQFSLTRDAGIEPYLFGLLMSVLVTAATYGIFRAIMKFHTWSAKLIHGWKGSLIQPVRIKSVEVMSEERIAEILVLSTKLGRFALFGFLAYFYISILLGLFPLTATWSETLFGYILTPVVNAVKAFVNYIPNLFSIIVILGITRYLLKFLQFISAEIGRGALSLPGFFPEWAIPTFKIVRFLVIVFAAIVIFPYLPGADSPFFQGISIFVGVLFSLGSSSAIANIVSGVVLTYMRPFKLGDRVKIADTAGDVIEKTLLVTRVRTIKNVDVTIPNAMVLGAHIVNYSSSAEDRGLILHTTVTIGYDVPWRKVHELLMESAKRTEHILEDPKPFILQTALNDFSVAYELNAYTDDPSIMAKSYSKMHENIQDVFNDAGVEILSPTYSALRDGNDAAMPPPPGSAPSQGPKGFRIRNAE